MFWKEPLCNDYTREWPGINGYHVIHIRADGARKVLPMPPDKILHMNQSVLVSCVCCILHVCTRSVNARKICLFTHLVKKNSCFSEVSQNTSPLVSTTKSHRILCSVTAQVHQFLLAQCSYPCLLLLTAFMGVGKKGPDFPHYGDLFQGIWMLQIPREWRDLVTFTDTLVTCQDFPKQQVSNMLGWSSRAAQVVSTFWVILICSLDVGHNLNNLCGQQPITDA